MPLTENGETFGLKLQGITKQTWDLGTKNNKDTYILGVLELKITKRTFLKKGVGGRCLLEQRRSKTLGL